MMNQLAPIPIQNSLIKDPHLPVKRRLFSRTNFPVTDILETDIYFEALNKNNLLQKMTNTLFNPLLTRKHIVINEEGDFILQRDKSKTIYKRFIKKETSKPDLKIYKLTSNITLWQKDTFFKQPKSAYRQLGYPDYYYMKVLDIMPELLLKIDSRFSRFFEIKDEIFFIKENIVAFYKTIYDKEHLKKVLQKELFMSKFEDYDEELFDIRVELRKTENKIIELKSKIDIAKSRFLINSLKMSPFKVYCKKYHLKNTQRINENYEYTGKVLKDSKTLFTTNRYDGYGYRYIAVRLPENYLSEAIYDARTEKYITRNQVEFKNVLKSSENDEGVFVYYKIKEFTKEEYTQYKIITSELETLKSELSDFQNKKYRIKDSFSKLRFSASSEKEERMKQKFMKEYINIDEFVDFIDVFFDNLEMHFYEKTCETEEEYEEKYNEFVDNLLNTDPDILAQKLGCNPRSNRTK